MIHSIWNTIFYEPLYNGLIFLVGVLPGESAAAAIVILTIAVKFLLYPLSKKSSSTQIKMRAIEGDIAAIKEKKKGDKEAIAKETMALYKEHGINPFSGCLTALIQLPIIIALYFVFLKGLVHQEGVLYQFIEFPGHIDMVFLGVIDLAKKSLVLAILAAAAQYLQSIYTIPKQKTPENSKASFADEFSRSMNMQIKYFIPVLIGFVAYSTSAAVALYFIVSSIFTIAQEYLVQRDHRNTAPLPAKGAR
ncbi:MAG: YidC/Oxa1 family membrane protein insertase [Patescibacteria group bacterium]